MNSPPSDTGGYNEENDVGISTNSPPPGVAPRRRVKKDAPPLKQVSRKKVVPPGDEEVGTSLNLGDFDRVHTLSISETRTLVQAVFADRKKRRPNWNWDKENVTKMQDYLEEFARFKNEEVIEALENIIQQKSNFEFFERTQIANLCPENADEAKTLIPSITDKISDEDLNEMLMEIVKLRQFSES